ncbi:FAD binding domain-containing protein [Schizophyllum commune]
MKESSIDALIIGAGPSGLMAATALKRAGVDVRIIDKRSHGISAGQADGIQPRTAEILQTYGLANELFRQGCQLRVTAFYDPSTEGDTIDLSGRVPTVTAPTARYPHITTLHQAAVENIFQDAMRSMGLEVERSLAPTSLEIVEERSNDPKAHAVKVHLASADSPHTTPLEVVNARFVIGTDGAHSWTRKTLGLVLEGEQTDIHWGVIDFVPDTDFPDIRNHCIGHTQHGSFLVIPREGDLVRFYVQLDKEALDLDEAGDFDRSKMSPEKLLETARLRLRPYYLNLKDAEAGFHWWTVYRIGQRVANKYGMHERVFLAGDATHTHSPKAGQGMNAGICDAHNLAWKIAQVLHGHADLDLLKTYELERRTFAQSLIAFDKEYATLFSTAGITHDEFLRAHSSFSPFISGMDFTYPPSTITRMTHQEYASGLIIGRPVSPNVFSRMADARPVNIHDMLPANGKFKVVVFAGDYTRSTYTTDVGQSAEGLTALLAKYGMDVVTILAGKQDPECVLPLPPVLRPHWSSVLVDNTDANGRSASEEYGIDPSRGAVVSVRPDSHVGAVVPLQHAGGLIDYFDAFLRL